MALTAATFCVFLTLETVDFFATDFFAAVLFVAFLLLEAGLATTFLVALTLTVLFRTEALAAELFDTVARFAFGFEADLAFTARFAVFEEVRFDVVRADDLRKPFERLLLIWV